MDEQNQPAQPETNGKMNIVWTVVALALVAAGVFLYIKNPPSEKQTAQVGQPEQQKQTEAHILGNPDAQINIALYFDINCPHCRDFHQTMKQLMEKYGKDGKINWVSKPFPLNPTSLKEAVAAECAAEFGGEQAYWNYLDKLMEGAVQPQEDLIKTTSDLAALAGTLNLNRDDFQKCIDENRHQEEILASRQEAVNLGANGTPFVVLSKNGQTITTIPGALPYEEMEKILDENLTN